MSEDKPRRRPRNGSDRSPTAKQKRKPELHLLKGNEITFEMLGRMFRKLTSREPTPEDIEEARREWDKLETEDKDKPDDAAAVPKRGEAMSNQQPEPAPNNEPMPSARRKQPRYGSGHVLLVDGPHDGRRISGFIARGRLEYEDGEYVHVLGGDDMALYWVEYPARVEAGPTEVEQSQKWLTSMLAKASPLMASIIEQHIQDVGLVAAYCNRGLLEAQMEYIESL